MADRARLVIDGNDVKVVLANELTEEDRNKEFRCCGGGCNAQLVPRIGYVRQFFTEDPKLEQHIYACPYKESYDSVRERTVARLARNVDEFSFDDLFEVVSKHKDTSRSPKGGGDGGNGDDDPDDKGGEGGGNPLILQREIVRPPRTLKEIMLLLVELDLEIYGKTLVRDILVDRRSVLQYRRNGVHGPKIVILWRAKPTDEVKKIMQKGDIYLEDAFPGGDESAPKLRMIVRVDNRDLRTKIGDQIYAKGSSDKWHYAAFAVWGIWRETSVPGVYWTNLNAKGQFMPLMEDEYRK